MASTPGKPTSKASGKSSSKASEKSSGGSSGQKNEGEGNKTAARHYNAGTEKFVKSGKVDAAAKAAEQAIEGPEGKTLRKAEKEGLKHSRH